MFLPAFILPSLLPKNHFNRMFYRFSSLLAGFLSSLERDKSKIPFDDNWTTALSSPHPGAGVGVRTFTGHSE